MCHLQGPSDRRQGLVPVPAVAPVVAERGVDVEVVSGRATGHEQDDRKEDADEGDQATGNVFESFSIGIATTNTQGGRHGD